MSKALKPKTDQTSFSSPAPALNKRILVVDDEVATADGIRSLLSPPSSNVLSFAKSSRSAVTAQEQAAGYEVTVVNSPHAALEAVRHALQNHKPFAMGFFDVLLKADIDGIQLVKQVMDLDPQIYAVFVTAYQDRSVDSINQFLGADRGDRWDYINKPFTDGEIIQKARSVTAIWNLQRTKVWPTNLAICSCKSLGMQNLQL